MPPSPQSPAAAPGSCSTRNPAADNHAAAANRKIAARGVKLPLSAAPGRA